MKYGIVVSKDHIAEDVSGSSMQANHGKQGRLKRIAVNDETICHPPKQNYNSNEPCQAFTAIGHVPDGHIYQHKMTKDFIDLIPWV